MPASRIGLPDNPVERGHHLAGLNSALQGWSEADIVKARPALEPYRSQFDGGRAVGLGMVRANPDRRRRLQQGVPGLVHRVQTAEAAKQAKKIGHLLP